MSAAPSIGVKVDTHDFREIAYRVRVVVVAEIVDRKTGALIASGYEEDIKPLYPELRKGAGS